jgi:hypothetical protein
VIKESVARDSLRHMTIRLVPVTLLTLLALGACGQGTTSTTAAGSPAVSSTTAPSSLPSSTASSTTGPEGERPVVGTGMEGGCDALHKTFVAIGGGDAEQAKRYRDAAHHLFSDVAATAATATASTDVKVAVQGATLASELELGLPAEQDAARSELARLYRDLCVGVDGYGAPAIGGF